VKAKMLTLATKATRSPTICSLRTTLARGFTLLELLVVLAIVAIAAGAASLSLRDSSATALERDAQRLAAILEAGRSQSRTTGLVLRWQPNAEGFAMLDAGADPKAKPKTTPWLSEGIIAQIDNPTGAVLLGPEPMIPAQAITLRLEERQIRVSTDGLRPFRIDTGAETAAAGTTVSGQTTASGTP
jgi:general secretion pathway protein H